MLSGQQQARTRLEPNDYHPTTKDQRMATLGLTRGHDRCQSISALPSSGRAEEKYGRAATIPTTGVDSVEILTFYEARQRKELHILREECSAWTKNISRHALHFQAIRRNAVLRGFIDTAREYDQELLHLKFHLAGPDKVHFIPKGDAERAISSLRRAKAILASAGWRVQKCVELWTIYANREVSGRFVRSEELEKFVDTGKLTAELECYRFWERVRPRFAPLIKELRKEVLRMRWSVQRLESHKIPSFVKDLKEDTPRNKISKTSAMLPCHTLTTKSRSSPYEMSGALPVGAAQKNPTWVNNLKVHFEASVLNGPMDVELGAASSHFRYRALSAREKLRVGDNPRASRDAWMAFRNELDSKKGPPSSDTILLRHKVDTNVILAERRLQQSGNRIRGGCDEDSGGQAEDEGLQAE